MLQWVDMQQLQWLKWLCPYRQRLISIACRFSVPCVSISFSENQSKYFGFSEKETCDCFAQWDALSWKFKPIDASVALWLKSTTVNPTLRDPAILTVVTTASRSRAAIIQGRCCHDPLPCNYSRSQLIHQIGKRQLRLILHVCHLDSAHEHLIIHQIHEIQLKSAARVDSSWKRAHLVLYADISGWKTKIKCEKKTLLQSERTVKKKGLPVDAFSRFKQDCIFRL